jgi:hypothetical protein
MTVLVICPRCHERRPPGRRCPCRPGERAGNGWARQLVNARVLARDGWRCTWLAAGERCTAVIGLEVAHIGRAHGDGGSDTDESQLATLCHDHHLAFDRGARNGRE